MGKFRIRRSELRQLGSLLAAVLEDSELMAELSVMDKEHVRGADEALRTLIPLVDERDMEDAVNES
jgi:hypothetical protein